jgi:hypothetical protein
MVTKKMEGEEEDEEGIPHVEEEDGEMIPEGIPIPQPSIPKVGKDNHGTIIIFAELVNFQVGKEDIIEVLKPRELFLQEDHIVPNELV